MSKVRIVYKQPYSRGRSVGSAYGTSKKVPFFGDVIHLQLCDGSDMIHMTPNEALDIIRALSAAVHHYLTDPKMVPPKRILSYLEKHK